MKAIDLFSGIGGFALGFERAGIETALFCEIDQDAQKVLRKNFPSVPIFPDIKKIAFSESNSIICGGFPCQDISVAGKQKGFKDEHGNETRSGLWNEYKRVISEVRPRWVVIENVRNLLNSGLAIVLKDLHDLGYNAEWEIISAHSVGACHRRERIWIVAYPCVCGQRGLQSGRSSGQSRAEAIRARGASETESTPDTNMHRVGVSIPTKVESEGIQLNGPCKNGESADFRFWPTFATEEEKREWWAKATTQFRNWWKTQPSVCGIDDGLPEGLDRNTYREYERARKARIKQLGNSIVPFIAEMIGRRIVEIEKESSCR